MRKRMIFISGIFLMIFIFSEILYYFWGWENMFSIAITFGTISYHFLMRLLVGYLYNFFINNKIDYKKKCFKVHVWETVFYKRLKVKKWKGKMPSFDASLYDPRIHSWDEILGAMCQAELVHETIVILSFLPIFAGRWFGAYPVFILTSVFAALIDFCFVIIQRYNRPRIIKMLSKKIGKDR